MLLPLALKSGISQIFNMMYSIDLHILQVPSIQYDVLGWWKTYGHRTLVLCEMVRDILGVPISTVPSESAFSTSGRVLDSFRSSLSPEIVEALICSGDWFRSANSSSQNVREYEDDLAELEDVVVACATNMDSNEEVTGTTSEAGNEDGYDSENDEDFVRTSGDENEI